MIKKYSIIAVSMLGIWHGVNFAEPTMSAQPTMSDNDMVLYSLGYEMGKDIKDNQLQFKQEIILQGAKDAMSGGEPLFNVQTQRQAMADIRKKRAEENLHASEAFLAENAKKEGVTTLPNGLQYKVITAGNGKTPTDDDTVKAAFRGKLLDGTEFESTYQHGKPAKFQVGKPIKGLSQAMKLMPVGSKWEIYIPPELAFGKRVAGKRGGVRVPANSVVIYELELLSIVDSEATAAASPKNPITKPEAQAK